MRDCFITSIQHHNWSKLSYVTYNRSNFSGVGDPLEIHLSPTCYPAKFCHSRSNGTTVIKICLKNLTLMSRFSRSLKVIGTDTFRSAKYDFLLTLWHCMVLLPKILGKQFCHYVTLLSGMNIFNFCMLMHCTASQICWLKCCVTKRMLKKLRKK